jgi:hypothetical protein
VRKPATFGIGNGAYRSDGGRSSGAGRLGDRSPADRSPDRTSVGSVGSVVVGSSITVIVSGRADVLARTPARRRAVDCGIVSHPSLGLPPPDLTAGFPAAAARLDATRARLAARALEVAFDNDPTLRDRYNELGLRKLLRDAGTLLDRIAVAVASGDPAPLRSFADWVAPIYRRRSVPMDDLINLAEGLRAAATTVLTGSELAPMHAAVDTAIDQFRWHRRIAGDARKKNRILQAIYKGA